MIPIKSAKEVDQMRLACRTASEILDRVTELVRPGLSTEEVDEAAADFMHEATVLSRVTSAFHLTTRLCMGLPASDESNTAISSSLTSESFRTAG